MMEYEIHTMQPEDVAQVAELEKRCFPDPWTEEILQNELQNELSLWLTAKKNGTVLGYIGSQTVLGESDMMNVAVSPNARRQGVGKALVLALCERLGGGGSTCLTLEVRASNEPAIALYGTLGFRQVGRRPNYYFHPKEDALILRKELET